MLAIKMRNPTETTANVAGTASTSNRMENSLTPPLAMDS